MLRISRLIVMAEPSAPVIKHNSPAVVQLLPLCRAFQSPVDWHWNGNNDGDSCRCNPIGSRKDSQTSSSRLLGYQYKMCPLPTCWISLCCKFILECFLLSSLIFFHTFTITFSGLFCFPVLANMNMCSWQRIKWAHPSSIPQHFPGRSMGPQQCLIFTSHACGCGKQTSATSSPITGFGETARWNGLACHSYPCYHVSRCQQCFCYGPAKIRHKLAQHWMWN